MCCTGLHVCMHGHVHLHTHAHTQTYKLSAHACTNIYIHHMISLSLLLHKQTHTHLHTYRLSPALYEPRYLGPTYLLGCLTQED